MEIHYEHSKVQEMWRIVCQTYFIDEHNFMYNNKNPVLSFRDLTTTMQVRYGKMLDAVSNILSVKLANNQFATVIVLTTDEEIESMQCLTQLFIGRYGAQEYIASLMSGPVV